MFLLAGELHPHRAADRARQQRSVGADVVGAVAAVAAGGFQPDHVDVRFRQRHQFREIGAQVVRVLRSGPHAQAAVAVVRDRTRRTYRAVDMIRPHVCARHRRRGAGQRLIDIAGVAQHARRARVGAQCGCDVFEVRQGRRRFPCQPELRGGADRVLLAIGDDTDEIADPHHGDEAGNIRHRTFIHRDQAGADEIAGINAGIGRAHHAAVQHAGHAHVMHIDHLAGGHRRNFEPGNRAADDLVGTCVLHDDIVVEFEPHRVARHQFGIADAVIVLRADQSVLERQRVDRLLQPFGGARQKVVPRLRRRVAQRHRGDLDGFAGDGRALVGRRRRVAQHHGDAIQRHVEFFRDDLRQRGADAGAEIDVAVVGEHLPAGVDGDVGFEPAAGCIVRRAADDRQRSGVRRGRHIGTGVSAAHRSRLPPPSSPPPEFRRGCRSGTSCNAAPA